MKKVCISFVIIIIIVLAVSLGGKTTDNEYLRIHIRANSNGFEDQSVKYEIKEEVVNYLIPFVASCDTKEKAYNMLKSNLKNIDTVANGVLAKNGFGYTAKSKLNEEEFPLRSYGDFSLESGIYDALIIELGEATGDNWWCVVYPPLCFTGEGEGKIKYRSKILEIIENFKKSK